MAVGFIVYDLVFLFAFTLAVVLFLYVKRKNLQRQGLLYLYRTKVGIKFINWTSKSFPKTLYVLQYVVIFSGYLLMISMIYLLIRFSYFYITSPIAAKVLKVPVIIPLVPYLPEIFNLDFLPPFYFTYWIIIIAIIAIPHEFAHGIFARLSKIKIHSTGFGFLGPFLAAFVEPDEKQMEKKKKFSQLAVLASGTFANVVVTIIASLILLLFFVVAFTPSGIIFNSYADVSIPINSINEIDGKVVKNVDDIKGFIDNEAEFLELKIENMTFFVSPRNLDTILENKLNYVPVYYNSPAFKARLEGAISEIDGEKITSYDKLKSILDKHSPGDNVTITMIEEESIKDYEVSLGEFNGKAFLGIGVRPFETRGLIGKFYSIISSIKNPYVYYESNIGRFGFFIYHLLLWIVWISISVALVNMLPIGIFDGGRFFYLTVWGLTGSKEIGEQAFKISTWLLLALIAALMVKWLFVFV